MEYELLGQLRVLNEEGAEVQLSAPKVRTLLALLLVNRGRPVSVDRIVDTLWGDVPPRTAPNLVQGYVRDLRRSLGANEVATVQGGYRLDVGRDVVDAERFEDLVRARRYEQALKLWRGTALAEWAEQPWARATVARLEEMHLSAREARLAQQVGTGLESTVLAELTALVEEHPLRERLRVLQIKALYAAGRQADALAAYAEARRYLADEVGLDPGPELRAVEAAVLAQDSFLLATPTRSSTAPPAPVTPLVGRESDLAALRSALKAARLVTLSGPGGIGKTRLAIEVAVASPPPGGLVWFVELAPVLASGEVATTVARALQLAESPGHEIDLLCDYLSQHRGLLVLDTCEHVVEAVAVMATRLLSRCPELRILATTRQPLRAPGEQIVQLSGLDEAAGAEVFTSRARAANPAAELDPDGVRVIVGKLEGLPLALELAASRIASLSLNQLIASLGKPLDALTGDALAGDPRHRTMRAVIGWSHELLDRRDREAFAALSVFAGSFDREAASAVVGYDASDVVVHLLGRSLLTRDVDLVGQARYRFLDPVRHFAGETATPTLRDRSRRRHFEYHASLAARVNDRIRTAEATAWAAVARAGADDLRRAVTYAISESTASAGRLVTNMYWPWFLDGQLSELRSWATAVLGAEMDPHVRTRLLRVLASTALAQGDAATAVHCARRQLEAALALQDLELVALAENLLGMAAWARGSYAAAGEHHRAAVSSARSCGQPWTLALVTALAGRSAHARGDHQSGEGLLREAETLAEEIGEPMVLGSALDYRAHAEFALGHTSEAAALASRSVAAYRRIGYQEGLASASTLAAQLAVLAGDHERAEVLLQQALDVSRRLRHLGGTASVLEAMAVLDHDRGDYRRAGRHLDDARALREQTGTVPSPALRDQLSRVERSVALEQ